MIYGLIDGVLLIAHIYRGSSLPTARFFNWACDFFPWRNDPRDEDIFSIIMTPLSG
jgi:hypothetical protein